MVGKTAPVLSWTVPAMEPVLSSWAAAVEERLRKRRNDTTKRRRSTLNSRQEIVRILAGRVLQRRDNAMDFPSIEEGAASLAEKCPEESGRIRKTCRS